MIVRLRIVPLKDTAQKHVIYTSFDTPQHATQMQTAAQTRSMTLSGKELLQLQSVYGDADDEFIGSKL